MTQLYWSSYDNVNLTNAIKWQKENIKNAIGLFYSSNWCKFGKLDENVVFQNVNKAIELDSVFEARIFNEDCELRWLNFSSGLGKAVFLSENQQNFKENNEALNFLESIEQKYLLWGEGVAEEKQFGTGWSKLATARIGKLDVPIEGIIRTEGVQLISQEYLGEIDDFGNVAVVEERLKKLESIKRKK